MTILITGGTGKTGSRLAQRLQAAGQSVIIASRSVNPDSTLGDYIKGVKFNWFDPSTFENPFKVDANIDKIYLITPPPPTVDRLAPMKPFIDLAVSKGVKSYFFENFKTLGLASIRDLDEIISAAGDGKVPYVAVDDIVEAAYEAITTPKIKHSDLIIVGPDLLTYDQVTEILSGALGRKINHKKVTVAESIEIRKGQGIPAPFAELLASLDDFVAHGREERVLLEKNKHVGKIRFADWVEENKVTWNKT